MNRPKAVIEIAGRKIGEGFPCFIIAEMSANHRQNYNLAVKIIKAAAAAGADAVKLQTYTPDTMTLDSDKKWFRVGGENNPDVWKGKTLFDLYKEAYTPWDWQPKLKKIADSLGIILFSTPFDTTSVDFLEKMHVPCYKISSYETKDVPLLKRIAKTKKPVIISTGYDTLADINYSLKILRENGTKDIAVLYCVTGYADNPNPDEINLATMGDIGQKLNVVCGFSDNNSGVEIPFIAACAGASIVEKHLTLKRKDGGADARFSLEPDELALMIKRIRFFEKAQGKVKYGPSSQTEKYNIRYQRSIFVSEDILKGEKITNKNVRVIRPGGGLEPKFFDKVMGMHAARDIEKGTPLSWKLINNKKH